MLSNQPIIDTYSECELSDELLSEGSSSNRVRDFAAHEAAESWKTLSKNSYNFLMLPEKQSRIKGNKSQSAKRLKFDNIDSETLSKQEAAEYTSLKGISVKDEIMKTLKKLAKKRKESTNVTCKSEKVGQIGLLKQENWAYNCVSDLDKQIVTMEDVAPANF